MLNNWYTIFQVEYFNNYLKDCRRPQLPEHPLSRQLAVLPPPRGDMGGPGFHGLPPPVSFYRHPGPPPMYHGNNSLTNLLTKIMFFFPKILILLVFLVNEYLFDNLVLFWTVLIVCTLPCSYCFISLLSGPRYGGGNNNRAPYSGGPQPHRQLFIRREPLNTGERFVYVFVFDILIDAVESVRKAWVKIASVRLRF